MNISRNRVLGLLTLACACLPFGSVWGQADARPLLPFEEGSGDEALGTNSFGRGTVLRSIHNESMPTPRINPDDFLPPPGSPQIPRIYLTIKYYGCRPWLIHPYTGDALTPSQVIRSIQTDCPTWPGRGRPIEELVQVNEQVGEPLVVVEDLGVVDESNQEACRDFEWEQESEMANAANVGVSLNTNVRSIIHAPYYGLYCLRIRLCIPVTDWAPDQVWRYWVRWPYRPVQSWCWSKWYWYRWYNHPTLERYVIYPWRPLCTPHTWWVRSGPDWVFNCVNVNRYRRWCLYGLRYHCYYWIDPIRINPQFPGVADLGNIQPDPSGAFTTAWLRPWPYPTVRYWPFQPYCTRWFWFRPLPWFQYRYLPPVLHGSIAVANAENGGGFLDGVNPAQLPAPMEPPTIGQDGTYETRVDSFFDIFVDAGECRWRAVEQRMGDHDGNGNTSPSDGPRGVRLGERGHNPPADLAKDADSFFDVFVD